MSPSPVFRVENLGPIRHGEVELRPLTLLIGKNNTGKTYMAQAIHACHKALRSASPDSPPTLSRADLEALGRLVASGPTGEPLALPTHLVPTVDEWIRDRFRSASACLPKQLQACFGIAKVSDLDSWNTSASFSVSAYHSSNGTPAFLFGTSDEQPDIKISAFEITEFGTTNLRDHVFEEDGSLNIFDFHEPDAPLEIAWTGISLLILDILWHQQFRQIGFGSDSYCLPTGRPGLLQAWTEVVKLKRKLAQQQIDPTRDSDSPGSGPSLGLNFDLQEAAKFPFNFGPRGRHDDSAMESALELMERAIDGTVFVDLGLDSAPVLIYQQNDNRIPLRRASSMVADLAPLALWTQEFVSPGDLLIVDEPETHLHPEARRHIARALVRLANAGVKVLCTTHSSVLIHQISNSMLAANASEEHLGYVEEDLGFPPEDRISHTDIGVYRFTRSHDAAGVEVVPVKIDPGWGISEDEYADSTDEIINQSADLIEASKP